MSGPPPTVESPTTLMVVNTWGEDAVFYDLETLAETARFPLPPQPHEIRHDVKRGLVYCSFPYRDGFYFAHEAKASELAIIDPVARRVVEMIDLAPEVGPHAMFLDEARDTLWLSVETDGGAVVGFDLDTHQVVSHVCTGEGVGKPHWMTLSADGRMYTANKESAFVSVIDVEAGVLAKQIPTPDGSEDVELSADGTRLYVSSQKARKLHVVDTETDEVCGEVELDDWPSRVALAATGMLLVTHLHLPFQAEGRTEPGRLSVVDPEALELVSAIQVGRTPVDMTVSGDGTRAYVANSQAGTIFEIDVDSMEIRRAIETGPPGHAPHGMLLL
jgi:DNA-binding beta-propeller fold protein YncE